MYTVVDDLDHYPFDHREWSRPYSPFGDPLPVEVDEGNPIVADFDAMIYGTKILMILKNL